MVKIMSIRNKSKITVKEVMLHPSEFPILDNKAILKDALEKMSIYKLGIVCIIDENKKFIGLITDGDVRRILLTIQKPLSALFMEDVLDHISKNPISISPEMSIYDATKLIGEKSVWDLPILSRKKELLGLFHLHRALDFCLDTY